MQLDAWFSMVVFTVATVAFYFLGAAVLHPQGLDPKGPEMIPTLSRMYLQPLEGTPLAWLRPFTRVGFLLGAWAVLFKTLYVATAANSRMTADFLHRVGRLAARQARRPASGWSSSSASSIRPLALGLYYAFREPQALITAGGIAQALMLPFIAGRDDLPPPPRRRPSRRAVAPERRAHLGRVRGDLGRRPLHHLQPAPGYRGRLGRPALRDDAPAGLKICRNRSRNRCKTDAEFAARDRSLSSRGSSRSS